MTTEQDKIAEMLVEGDDVLCGCSEIGDEHAVKCSEKRTHIVYMVMGFMKLNILHPGCEHHCERTRDTFAHLGAMMTIEVETIFDLKKKLIGASLQ
jgi:hypothetical protein